MKVTTVGLDLAKQVFSVHGVDEHGKAVLRKRLSRGKLLEFFAQLPPALVGMEACSTIVPVERRLHPHTIATSAEKILQNAAALSFL